jgi:hypothetical protein
MSISHRLFAICLALAFLSIAVVALELRTVASAAGQPVPALALLDKPRGIDHLVPVPRRSLHRSFQQSSKTEMTIGENKRHTNIQVLKEFPDSQLIPMMNLMSASLGVKCDFCHTFKDGRLDPAPDDKPEKKTAREMLTMTLNINKTTFDGRSEVSCFTCHGGRTRPVGVPVLPLPEAAPRPGRGGPAGPGGPGAGAPASQPAAPQLTADDVLNKYIAAIGGQAAIDKLKTRVMKGSYTTGGNSMNLEIDQAAPDKVRVIFVSPQGQMERGFDGSAGWEKNPRGVNDLPAPQLADLKSGFGLFRDIKLKEQFTRMSVRKEKLDGKDVNVITGSALNGKRERLYFDATTGLLLRRIISTQTPIGVIPEETDYEDYRDVDGVKIPFTIKTAGIDGSQPVPAISRRSKSTPPSTMHHSISPQLRTDRAAET